MKRITATLLIVGFAVVALLLIGAALLSGAFDAGDTIDEASLAAAAVSPTLPPSPNHPSEATATPRPEPTSTPAREPAATSTPQPTSTPMPEPTATSEPTAEPEPTTAPVPTAAPAPTAIPTPIAAPTVVAPPAPTAPPDTPAPEPSGTPEVLVKVFDFEVGRGYSFTWVFSGLEPDEICVFVDFVAPGGGMPTEIREPKQAGADGTLQDTWTTLPDEPTGLAIWAIRCGNELWIARINVI